MTRVLLGWAAVALFAPAVSAGSSDPKDVWVYQQSSGELRLNGKVIARGYSGHGKGLNNPGLENVANVGPIPRGEYTIGESFKHASKGPTVMRLTPAGHNAHGRTGFLIHGDNAKMNQSASEGCIILGPAVRQQVAESKIKRLLVTR